MANAYRVLDDLGDGSIPVVAPAIVEYAVATDHQIIDVPRGDGRHYRPLLSIFVSGAFAIQQIGIRKGSESHVFGDVLHRQT